MSTFRKSRRRLKAHDRGDNRHVKSVAWARKVARISSASHDGRKPKSEREVVRADVEPLAYDRSAERPSLAEQIAAWARRGDA